MARIAVEVGSGAVRYRVAIQAGSAERALEIAEGLNHGRSVAHTVEPNGRFSGDHDARTGQIEQEKPAA